MSERIAKRYIVRGRVQGVGFRAFVQQKASMLKIVGWVRNLDDGSVEVYAIGQPAQIADLEGQLRLGPRGSDVCGFNQREDVIDAGLTSFRIR